MARTTRPGHPLLVKVSYHQKPYRRVAMETWGGEVVPSPSSETNAGRQILAADPETTGSLGIGPAFQWNLFDHGRIENNVRLQDARLQQLIESYQDTVLQAAREIDDAAISVARSVFSLLRPFATPEAAMHLEELATHYAE